MGTEKQRTKEGTDAYLWDQLRRTEGEVRRVELFSSIFELASVSLFLFVLGAIFDHWIFRTGLSSGGRYLCCGIFFGVLLILLIRRLVLTFSRRLNPLYSAKILEELPEIEKNSIINWLQLHDKEESMSERPGELGRYFLEGVTLQAARDVHRLPSEMRVDHSPIIRWGIRLLIVVIFFLTYLTFSPKSTLTSICRVVLPGAAISAPQSVQFLEIKPGDISLFQGDFVEIEAEILNVRSRPVYLLWSTTDRRLVDQPIEMTAKSSRLFSCRFPLNKEGLAESLQYQLVVGSPDSQENRSDLFSIDVRPALVFSIEQLHFQYPEYTRLKPKRSQECGEIRALDGTSLELTARSNVPIEKAFLIPGDREAEALQMTRRSDDPRHAVISFLLSSAPEKNEGALPLVSSIELVAFDPQGNRNPVRNIVPVVIIPDQAPIVHWEKVPEGSVRLPVNQRLSFVVRVEDPDFGLDSVRLFLSKRELQAEEKRSGEPMILPEGKELLPIDKKGKTGDIILPGSFIPQELGLTVGGEYEYWIEAIDTCLPAPNRSRSEKKLFLLDPAVANPQNEEEEPSESKENEQKGDSGSTKKEKGGNSSSGAKDGESEQKEGDNSDPAKEEGSERSSDPSSQRQGEGSGAEKKEQGNASEKEGEQGGAGSQGGKEGAEGKEQSGQSSQGTGSNGSQENSQDGASPSSSKGGEQGEQGTSGSSNASDSSDPQEKNPENSKEGDANGRSTRENSEGNSSESGEDSPIDPEANPGDAFERILDQQRKESEKNGGKGSLGDSDPARQGTGETDEIGKGRAGTRSHEPQAGGETGEGASSEEKNSSEKPPKKAPMPTNPGERSAGPDAERFTADSIDQLPAGLTRDRGLTDPKTNNYMIQNSKKSNGQEKQADRSANVVQDPDDPRSGTSLSAQEKSSPMREMEAKRPEELGSSFDAETGENKERKNDKQRKNEELSDGVPGLDPQNLPKGGSGGNGQDPMLHVNQPDDGRKGAPGPNEGGVDSSGKDPGGKEGAGGVGHASFQQGQQALSAEAPHLKYTEQATELALDYIEEQLKNGTDRELRQSLGWTEEQLRAFLQKWRKMSQNAKKYGVHSKEYVSYLESLHNIGLRAPGEEGAIRASSGLKDRGSVPSREGAQWTPPDRYKERFRAYHQGISSKKEDN